MKFFNQAFWQQLLIHTLSSTIVLAFAVFVSMYVGGKLDSMTRLFESVEGSMTSIQSLLEVDPARITEISTTLQSGAETLGAGVGDGGSTAVEKIGTALERLRKKDE